MIITVSYLRKKTDEEVNQIIKHMESLGWKSGGTSCLMYAQSKPPIKNKVSSIKFIWSLDAEPVFPTDIEYTIDE